MRRYLWIILCPLLFSYCSTEPLIGDFAMEYVHDIEVPAGIAPIGSTFIVIQNIDSNADLIFNANGALPGEVNDIRTSFLSLQAINPATENWDFLREITMFIETDDLPRLEVGYRDQIFNTNNTLDMIPSITQLSEYLKSDRFNLIIEFEPNQTTQSFITTRVRVQFQAFVD
ncbi:MAG: hypothetical protein AAF502_15015 [Bacteroidota bacterium]